MMLSRVSAIISGDAPEIAGSRRSASCRWGYPRSLHSAAARTMTRTISAAGNRLRCFSRADLSCSISARIDAGVMTGIDTRIGVAPAPNSSTVSSTPWWTNDFGR